MLNVFINLTNCDMVFQNILEEIMNSDSSGTPVSAQHSKKKVFLDNFKRCLAQHGNSKHLIEAAAVTCVKLCKASTYINNADSNHVVFVLVQSILNDLKVRISLSYDQKWQICYD